MPKKPSIDKKWKAGPKHDSCALCKSIDGSYRIIHYDEYGRAYCLGCQKRAEEAKRNAQ